MGIMQYIVGAILILNAVIMAGEAIYRVFTREDYHVEWDVRAGTCVISSLISIALAIPLILGW